MFTGIIESLGKVVKITSEEDNLHFDIACDFKEALQIDQSVAHNGVCMTVVALNEKTYRVTAIKETLLKTNLIHWKVGDLVNLERCMRLNDRLDGHLVQGHVDQIAQISCLENQKGSYLFTFEYEEGDYTTVEKGSIGVNGVSLTVVNAEKSRFSAAIIPYTYAHTTFQYLKQGDWVNLEFDIIGKYVARLMTR